MSDVYDVEKKMDAERAKWRAQSERDRVRAENDRARLVAERDEARRWADAYKRDWEAELEGAADTRKRHGARDNESYGEFIDRLAAGNARAEAAEARTWIQCSTVSNECLGGCRTMREHDRYVAGTLASEVEALRPLEALLEDMTRQKRAMEARAEAAEADNAAFIERCTCPVSLGLARGRPGAPLLKEVRQLRDMVAAGDGLRDAVEQHVPARMDADRDWRGLRSAARAWDSAKETVHG